MNYIDAIRKTAKRLEAEFEKSELVMHNQSKGIIREYIIKNCIRPFLPDAYGISSGECFDINGTVSRQLDVVVYDKLFFMLCLMLKILYSFLLNPFMEILK